MENEDYKITVFGNATYQLFRNGKVNRLMKHGWKQIGNTPHKTTSGKYYYRTSLNIDGVSRDYKLHRILAMVFLGLDINNKTTVIDHLDGNGLNNDLTNLRICSNKENSRNRKNTKGVTYDKINKKFKAFVTNNEGRKTYFDHKDHDTALRWRQAKEIEYGYLTRSTGMLI